MSEDPGFGYLPGDEEFVDEDELELPSDDDEEAAVKRLRELSDDEEESGLPDEEDTAEREGKRLRLVERLGVGIGQQVLDIVGRRADALMEGMRKAEEKPGALPAFDQLATAYQQVRARPVVVGPLADLSMTSPAKKGDLTKKGVKDAIHGQRNRTGMHTGKVKQMGQFKDKGIASGAKYKVGQRGLQLLSQLSQALIDAMIGNTQEIESMAVNDRILVGANEAGTVSEILALNVKKLLDDNAAGTKAALKSYFPAKTRKIGQLAQGLVADKPFNELTADELTGLSRLAQLELDLSQFDDQESAVSAVLGTLHQVMTLNTKIVAGGDPASAAKLITDPNYKYRIILVNAFEMGKKTKKVCSHAEQNLIYTLVLSGYKGGKVSVAGGKRPCFGCWTSFRLAKDAGYQLEFNENPGGLYVDTTYQGLHRIAEALGLSDKVVASALKTYAPDDKFRQFITDIADGAPTEAPVDLWTALEGDDVLGVPKSSTEVSDWGSPSQSPVASPLQEYYPPLTPIALRISTDDGPHSETVLTEDRFEIDAADVAADWLDVPPSFKLVFARDHRQDALILLTSTGANIDITSAGQPTRTVKPGNHNLDIGDRINYGPFTLTVAAGE